MGKIDNVAEVKTKIKTDKIYILQDTNKIQEVGLVLYQIF